MSVQEGQVKAIMDIHNTELDCNIYAILLSRNNKQIRISLIFLMCAYMFKPLIKLHDVCQAYPRVTDVRSERCMKKNRILIG